MKKVISKILGIIGMCASAFSGLFWYLSATSQLAATPNATFSSSQIEKLIYLASYQNFWAAFSAMIAGIVLGLAILID